MKDLSKCEKLLNYEFQNIKLLKRALTHASLRGQNNETCNERLEFLGDAVLGLVISDYLFTTFRDFDEGDLSLIKSTVVSRVTLAKLATKLQLSSFVSIANTQKTGKSKEFPTSVLANIYEAIVGAIYLDGGLEASKKFILNNTKEEIESTIKNPYQKNYKTLLQFLCQKHLGVTPTYQLLKTPNPKGEKAFNSCAIIGHRTFVAATGKNKKDAEQMAAHNALQILCLENPVIAENVQKHLCIEPEYSDETSLKKTPTLFHNSKSLLQHVTQKYRFAPVKYKRIHIDIDRDKKYFYIAAAIGGRVFPEARATKIKEAERLAARKALETISEERSQNLILPEPVIPPPIPLWYIYDVIQ